MCRCIPIIRVAVITMNTNKVAHAVQMRNAINRSHMVNYFHLNSILLLLSLEKPHWPCLSLDKNTENGV
jgi:hypothetical protein